MGRDGGFEFGDGLDEGSGLVGVVEFGEEGVEGGSEGGEGGLQTNEGGRERERRGRGSASRSQLWGSKRTRQRGWIESGRSL